MFYSNDPYELPIRYLTIKKISDITGVNVKALYKRFRSSDNNVITIGDFSYERFRKESE
jgi:hypothetical protein